MLQLKDLEGSGWRLRTLPDGSLRGESDRVVLHSVQLQLPPGHGVAARVTLLNAALRVGAPASQPSFQLLGLQAGEVLVEGAELALAPGFKPGGHAAGGWRLDAFDHLDGRLRLFIRDAAWVVDADVAMHVTGGRLDFDEVVVEHVGPNSSMGIGRNSIYIDAPNLGRTDLFRFSAASVPGAVYETRGGSRVTDRGSIDLKEFLEAMLEAPADQAIGGVAGREVEVMLDRTKLDGELRLGDGALGTERHHVELAGQAEGRNRISLTAAVLGQRLVVRLPELCASGARFELFGRSGRSGALSASIELHATGLSRSSAQRTHDAGIAATVHKLSLRDVVLGET